MNTPDAWAAALLDPGLPCPGGLSSWNGSDPARRFAVYRNNVVSSLVDALAESFPVVQQLVGEEFFRAMAAVHVRQSPPRSRVLAHYGEGFADFAEAFVPARGLPYLGDVARLEYARVRAFHAADGEPLSREAMASAMSCGGRAGELLCHFHPSACLLALRHAAVSLWAAHQEEGALEAIDLWQPESALVLRRGDEVLVLPLAGPAACCIAALLAGQDLAAAAHPALQLAEDFDLATVLVSLAAHGALTSLHLPEEAAP